MVKSAYYRNIFSPALLLISAIIFTTLLLYSPKASASEEVAYSILSDGTPIAQINISSNYSYNYISIKKLLEVLKVETEEIDSDGSYRFKWKNRNYAFNPSKKILTKNKKEYNLNSFEYLEAEKDLLIETNSLFKLLSIDAVIDSEAREIRSKKLKIQKTANQGNNRELTLVNDNNLNEDHFLVFEIRIDDLAYDELIDAYQHDIEEGSAVYVSLNQFIDILEFPIKFEGNSAKGWFLNQNNVFDLDLKNKTLQLQDKSIKIKPEEFFIYDEEIYIAENKIKEWFPIDYEINFSAQYLKIKPLVLLPFQEKKVRELKRKLMLKFNKERNYEKVIPEYQQLSLPKADITFDVQASGRDSNSPDYTSTYSGFIVNETLSHTTEAFFTGNKEQITNFRFKGNKIDPYNNLFEKGISSYSFGDVSAEPVSLISGSNLGRGLKFSTYDINRPEKFSKKTFEGNIQPGWEVELYRNELLVSFQTVGADGRYLFEDVDILYGKNIFKLIFYGPQGEIEEKEEEISIKNNLLEKGDYNFLVSANQKNKALINTDNNSPNTLNNVTFKGEFGVTEEYTASTALVVDDYLDSNNQKESTIFQSFNFTKEIFSVINNLDAGFNYSDFGYALKQNSIAKYLNTNVNFQQIYYHNFTNQARVTDSDPTRYQADLSLDKVISFLSLENVGINLTSAYQVTENSKKTTTILNSINFVHKGLIYANTLSFRTVTGSEENFTGNFSVRANKDAGFYRLGASYDLRDDNVLKNASFSLQSDKFWGYILRGDVNRSFGSNETTSFDASLNRKFDKFLVGLNAGYDSNSNYNFGITVSLSLHNDDNGNYKLESESYSSYGNVKAFAFLDDNFNGTHQESEEILENVRFRKSNKYIESENKKIIEVNNLPSGDFSDISIDALSLEDPLWYPAKEGYSVFARAGSSQTLAFAVQQTSEIEGTVALLNEEENENPISGLKVHLVNDQGKFIKTVNSEFDGYFLIEKVLPGSYFLIADENQMNELEISQKNSVPIEVTSEDDFYSDNYLYLKKNKKEPDKAEPEEIIPNENITAY